MNLLILGANGQLGQDFIRYCIINNIRFLASDIQNTFRNDNINQYKKCDISEFSSILSLVKQDKFTHIINCSAYNLVDRAESEWQKAYLINGLGPKFVSLAANEIGATVIHFSSDYVFDGSGVNPYTILNIPAPINKYGESKLLGEINVRDIATRYFLIRTSWVFGVGNNNFVKKVILWSQTKDELFLTIDETSSPTYTVDLVLAMMKLIKKETYGLYHITNSSCSRFEWGKFILERIGWKGKLIKVVRSDFNLPATRPKFSVLDNFGLYETINWKMPSWQVATKRFLIELKNKE